MAHEHLEEAKRTQRAKIEKIVGHSHSYTHPADKADGMAYYENNKLDPLPPHPEDTGKR